MIFQKVIKHCNSRHMMSRDDEVMIYMYYLRHWHSGIGTVSSPLESQMMD